MSLDETRNGILKCLENKGSTAPMKVLHGYSKLIHQVAHREFSEVIALPPQTGPVLELVL